MAESLTHTKGLTSPETLSSLMDLMQARGVIAFRLRSGDEEIEIRWPEASAVPSPGAPAPAANEPVPAPSTTLHAVTSPSVGTYFASPEPGKPAFVKLGQRVSAGEVVCVVESMKLMNEIEADVDGVVFELPVPNGGSVQAGEVVCLLRLDDDS